MDVPFEGSYEDRLCVNCKQKGLENKYRTHKRKILDLGVEFLKVCEKYESQMYHPKRRTFKQGQNVSISIKNSLEMLEFSWVKVSDEILKHQEALGELKEERDDGFSDDDKESAEIPKLEPKPENSEFPPPKLEYELPVASAQRGLFDDAVADVAKCTEPADAGALIFKLNKNQELRFEVKAETNQQARKNTAVLILREGFAEICGAELAEARVYAVTRHIFFLLCCLIIMVQVRIS